MALCFSRPFKAVIKGLPLVFDALPLITPSRREGTIAAGLQ